MGSYQKAPQKGITKLQYLFRGSFVSFLFQLTIITENLTECINQPLDDPEAQKERLEKAIRYLIKRK